MTTDLPASDASSTPIATPIATAVAPPRRAPLPWAPLLREGLLVVAAFAVAGVTGGWLWQRLADAPSGVAYEGEWLSGVVVQGGVYTTDYEDLGRGFGVVALFVIIGLVGGTAVGILAAIRARRSEIGTLVAVAVGSALAAYLAYQVGVWLGPPDPDPIAKTAENGELIAGALGLQGKSPWLMWSLGALAGLTFTYVLSTGVEVSVSEMRRLDDDPAWPQT